MANFPDKNDLPKDGSARQRRLRYNEIYDNVSLRSGIIAGTETLDGIDFTFTDGDDLLNKLQVSLIGYLFGKTEYDLITSELESISAGMTPAGLLALIKQVDGAGSGLDADLLGGKNSNEFSNSVATGASTEDPNITSIPNILTNHANSPDSLFLWYVSTSFWTTAEATSNRMQIAVEYNPSNGYPRMYTRRYFGSWGEWTEMLNGRLYGAPIQRISSTVLDKSYANKTVYAGATITITVPANVFKAGDVIVVDRTSSGAVTLSIGSGMTMHSIGNKRKIKDQYGSVAIKFYSPTLCYVSGSLE